MEDIKIPGGFREKTNAYLCVVKNENTMCLQVFIANNELPIAIAEKDIPCLKILEIDKAGSSDDACHVTPYRGVKVPPEVLSGEKNFLPKRQEPGDYEVMPYFDSNFRLCAEVSSGAIHTFACAEDSAQTIASEICFLRRFLSSRNTVTVVYLCVIPEGTEYMEGTFDEHKCYGSKAVRFERELLRYDGTMDQSRSQAYAKIQRELAPLVEEIIQGETSPAASV